MRPRSCGSPQRRNRSVTSSQFSRSGTATRLRSKTRTRDSRVQLEARIFHSGKPPKKNREETSRVERPKRKSEGNPRSELVKSCRKIQEFQEKENAHKCAAEGAEQKERLGWEERQRDKEEQDCNVRLKFY
ncbi:hypothetical protein C8R44DRAFT_747984 [Mycena epipterygia]|nr:hypothetical protein C8R44DRAFT_747984 [Mycena epipterygia]